MRSIQRCLEKQVQPTASRGAGDTKQNQNHTICAPVAVDPVQQAICQLFDGGLYRPPPLSRGCHQLPRFEQERHFEAPARLRQAHRKGVAANGCVVRAAAQPRGHVHQAERAAVRVGVNLRAAAWQRVGFSNVQNKRGSWRKASGRTSTTARWRFSRRTLQQSQ